MLTSWSTKNQNAKLHSLTTYSHTIWLALYLFSSIGNSFFYFLLHRFFFLCRIGFDVNEVFSYFKEFACLKLDDLLERNEKRQCTAETVARNKEKQKNWRMYFINADFLFARVFNTYEQTKHSICMLLFFRVVSTALNYFVREIRQ